MSPLNFTHILTQAVDELSESESYKGLFHQHTDGNPLPSAKALCDIIELARAIIFPGYFGNSTVNSRTVTYHIGVNVERLFDLLTEQILAGLCFGSDDECSCCTELQREEAASIAARFISHLPELRRILATDVEAAYNGDPAAHSFGEVISCYPAIRAISNYRIAHELLVLGVPLIPRNRYRHSSGSCHRRLFHDRPRYRCGNRRDLHHRQERKTIPGCNPRSQKFPAGPGR